MRIRLLLPLGLVAACAGDEVANNQQDVTTVTIKPAAVFAVANAQTTTVQAADLGADAIADNEVDQGLTNDEDSDTDGGVKDRTIVVGPGAPVSAAPKQHAKSNPELATTFGGLNFFAQRFA